MTQRKAIYLGLVITIRDLIIETRFKGSIRSTAARLVYLKKILIKFMFTVNSCLIFRGLLKSRSWTTVKETLC